MQNQMENRMEKELETGGRVCIEVTSDQLRMKEWDCCKDPFLHS